jgi:hypothetical protein
MHSNSEQNSKGFMFPTDGKATNGLEIKSKRQTENGKQSQTYFISLEFSFLIFLFSVCFPSVGRF